MSFFGVKIENFEVLSESKLKWREREREMNGKSFCC